MLVSAAINDISADVWLHFRHIFNALDISLSHSPKRKEWYFNIIYIKLPRPKQRNTPPIPTIVNKHAQIQTKLPPQTNIAQFYNLFVNPVRTNQRKRLTENNCNFVPKRRNYLQYQLWRAKAPETKECHTKTLRFCLSKSLCERPLRKLVKEPQKPIAGICLKRLRWAEH